MLLKDHKLAIILYLLGFLVLIGSFFLDNMFLELIMGIQNPLLIYLLEWVNYGLFLVLVLLFVTSIFMWEEGKKDWIIPSWVTFLSTFLFVVVLKFLVARERPVESLIPALADLSFPSVHIALCFSMLPIIDRTFPNLKWFWIIFALVVALGKLYLGLHYLSDAIAGALIGLSIGLAALHLKKKYNLFKASV